MSGAPPVGTATRRACSSLSAAGAAPRAAGARRVDPRFAALVGIVLRLLGVQRLRLLGREEFGKVTLYLTTESYAAGEPPAAQPLPRC